MYSFHFSIQILLLPVVWAKHEDFCETGSNLKHICELCVLSHFFDVCCGCLCFCKLVGYLPNFLKSDKSTLVFLRKFAVQIFYIS